MNLSPMPSHAIPVRPPRDRHRRAGDEPFQWGALVARVLNEVQVAIIEALLWIELPLAPSDLSHMTSGVYHSSNVAHHLKMLASRGILEVVDLPEPAAGSVRRGYVLALEFRWR